MSFLALLCVPSEKLLLSPFLSSRVVSVSMGTMILIGIRWSSPYRHLCTKPILPVAAILQSSGSHSFIIVSYHIHLALSGDIVIVTIREKDAVLLASSG